jgi:hypothetical protein
MVMLLGGYPAFAILFAAAGIGRFTAARVTELPAPLPARVGPEPHPA